MAAKFSMANTSGLFGAEAHAEASDRMQQAMEDLRIKHEKKQQLVEQQHAQHAQHQVQEAARHQRQLQHQRASAAQKQDFVKSQRQQEEEEEEVVVDDDDEKNSQPDQEEEDDALNDDGFEDPELLRLREARLKQLKAQYAEKQALRAKGHGEYQEITQDEFLKQVTSSHWVLVHFYHRDFERCKVMDMHLARLALRHIECKFLRINAEKAPFFVDKLRIRVLPTVVCFQAGIAFPDRLVGFEGLGEEDDDDEQEQALGSKAAFRQRAREQADSFPTSSLARRLESIGVIKHCDEDHEPDRQ